MDTIDPTFMLLGDRPLLGALALAACLAGGSGSHGAARSDLGGIPHRIDGAGFAPGWESGAPAAPHAAIVALQVHLAESSTKVSRVAHAAYHAPAAAEPRVKASPALAARPMASGIDSSTAGLTRKMLPESAALSAGTAEAETVPALAPVPAVQLPQPAPTAALAAVSVPVSAQLGTEPAATFAPPATMIESQPLRIVSSPELRRFDLAKFRAAPAKPVAKLAASRTSSATGTMVRQADRLIDDVVYHHAAVSVGGQAGGDIAVRIGPDMKPSVKVADLLGLVSAQMDPDSLARFTQAGSAGEYVSFATLRSAGFDVSYNAAADSIAISVTP